MTVNTSNITSGPYSGNGITVNFSYTFRVDTSSQLAVYLVDSSGTRTLQVETTNYTVTGVGDDDGGTVTFITPPATGETVYMRSNYQLTQLTDFDSQGGFFPDVHESAFDKTTFLIQQLNDSVSRSVRTSSDDPDGVLAAIDEVIPNAFLRFNSDGDGIEQFAAAETPITAEIPATNIAGLQAVDVSTLSTGNSAQVSYRSTIDDGGAACYVWNPADLSTEVTADEVTSSQGDGVKYVAPASDRTGASGAWVLREEPIDEQIFGGVTGAPFLKTTSDIINGLPISAHRFIAKNKISAITGQTSTADITTEFQDGIDTILSANRASLYVPNGLYITDTGLTVSGSAADNFKMYGEGRFSRIRTTNAVDVLTMYGTSGANTFQNSKVMHIALEANNASARAMYTRNTELMHLYDITFTGSGKGLVMSLVGGESDVKPEIMFCRFGGSLTHGIQGGDTRVADVSIICPMFIDVTQVCIEFGYLDGGLILSPKMFSNNAAANSLRGINLKNPIHVNIHQAFAFELGGEALKLSSPKHCKFDGFEIVGIGDNANQPAIEITDFNSSTPGYDNVFQDFLVRDVEGHGFECNSANSLQTDYTFRDIYCENVGVGTTSYDAMRFTNFEAKLRDIKIIGNEQSGGTIATRYPLHLDNSDIDMRDVKWSNTVNDSVNRVNSPTIVNNNMVMNVTATTTLTENEDGCVIGTLSGAITVNLPSAAAVPGKKMTLVNSDGSGNNVTYDPAGSQTIDGATTKVSSTQYETVTIISDGSNWVTQ